jgi:glycosyltransferase involved in cell wall biosynthesis
MRKKICFVVAQPDTAESFLRDHIEALRDYYDVYLVANIKAPDEVSMLALTGWHRVQIARGISIVQDIKAVWSTFRYFRKMQFDAVHSVTPKAGLVSALAGYFAGIKHRTHIFTGQVWATRTGFMRWILKSMDKMIASLNNHMMVDGFSQRSFLIKEKVLHEGQAEVFHKGSINGVNAKRFAPDTKTRNLIRKEIGISDDCLTYIFLGRLNHDKGIGELYEAYNKLAGEVNRIYLLLVGDDEENYISKLPAYQNIKDGVNFYFYGLTHEPEKVLNAGDIFVLPTYREGFGTSVLEAACIGIPCICSDAYGVLDAYVENETGLRCHVGDAESLYQCMKKMYENPNLVKQMGLKSRQRALNDFSGAVLTKCWVDFYNDILGK